MLTEYEFGIEAVPYIESQLLRGKTLSAYVLRNQALERGRIIAYLPANTPFEQRVKFLAGGILNSPEHWLRTTELIAAFLSAPGKRFAVFEDAYAQPTDPWINEAKDEFLFFFESEVYHALRSQDRDAQRIIRTLRAGHTYPCIGLLTSLPDDESFVQDRGQVTRDVLKILATRAEHLLIGAYDNETELIWTKR